MYCPLLCINPERQEAAFGQCIEEACAWWLSDGATGKCAICQMGASAAAQTEP